MAKVITSQTLRKRKIPNVWVLCGSCSIIRKAKKQYTVRINPVFDFLGQLEYSIENKFGRKLPIFFGPVSYIDDINNGFTHDEQPLYFSKSSSYKDDLEFRIVVYPPYEIKNLEPETFKLPEPGRVVSKVLTI